MRELREMREKSMTMLLVPLALLPLYLAKYMLGSVKRPQTQQMRGSWH